MLLWGSITAQKMLTVPTFSIIVHLISASLLGARNWNTSIFPLK